MLNRLGFVGELFEKAKQAFMADAPGNGDYIPTPVRPEEYNRPRLSGILPYDGYMAEERLFSTTTALGFVLEISPQTGADEEMAAILSSLYANCPAGTGVQFLLFGNNNLLRTFTEFGNLRPKDADADALEQQYGRPVRNTNIHRVMARKRTSHLMKGTRRPLFEHVNYMLRDFRILCSVVLSGKPDDRALVENLLTLREGMGQTFKSAGFATRDMTAKGLINFLYPILNPTKMFDPRPVDDEALNYDEGRPLRAQMVEHHTVARVTPKGMIFGTREEGEVEVRCYSPISYPSSRDGFPLWNMGRLIGDAWQDTLKYSCPFMIVMGVQVQDFNSTKNVAVVRAARAVQNADSKMARFDPAIPAQLQDWQTVVKRLDEGHGMVRMYHQLVLFSPPKKIAQAELNATAIWRACGFTLTNDRYMQKQAYLASLPLTLCKTFADELWQMERMSTKTTQNAIHLAPLLAEWKGCGDPVMMYFGRRGQVMPFDFFANRQGNYNFAITGVSGSGKTALMNDIALSYLATGTKVFAIDVGRGYEKLCRQLGGTFIEFRKDAPICINPFSWVVDISEDMKMLKPLLAGMASHGSTLPNYERSKLEEAISASWHAKGRDAEITDVADYLMTQCFDGEGRPDKRARDVGVQLFPYTKNGMYGKFFTGPATIDLAGDFIVLELEELKGSPDLQAAVLSIVMYRITYEMYLSRDRRKVCLIDEAWQMLLDSKDTEEFIAQGYRKARKYDGAFGTGTQGVRDYYQSAAAQAAYVNSDWKIYLRQDPEQIELLEKEGKLTLGDSLKRQILSLRTESGMYSEAVVRSPMGSGVIRILLDPFTLLLASSRAEDFNAINAYRAQGMSVTDAIEAVLADRGLFEGELVQ